MAADASSEIQNASSIFDFMRLSLTKFVAPLMSGNGSQLRRMAIALYSARLGMARDIFDI
jgi:hypothetical protein